ncbi:hypothetical protein Taro_027976 [Colocasia esculenta]|uniref:Uncharacterized protein n=1 Tax=Colocasia esculenta TaxID=4460 RepID=A0A843VJN2_COLES|nr:hypothetical protein [Colocasia esculenta]
MPPGTRHRTAGSTTEQQVWLTEQVTCSVPSAQENPSSPSSPCGGYNGYTTRAPRSNGIRPLPAVLFPFSKCRLAWLRPKQEITSTLLAPSVGTNERPCALPERLIFMRPAHPYPHWGAV